ncbi:hypothetical protein B0H16DRAFT_1476286 [Mycena metata]|uniref:Uncharacterized protein n=1 Tax=Mycena metata TaxID=1033252 RepID=A0AAD7HC89_9AGAR|nr:hypothetical protein B0H16DRAFT_1476286 [Mycena metata]
MRHLPPRPRMVHGTSLAITTSNCRRPTWTRQIPGLTRLYPKLSLFRTFGRGPSATLDTGLSSISYVKSEDSRSLKRHGNAEPSPTCRSINFALKFAKTRSFAAQKSQAMKTPGGITQLSGVELTRPSSESSISRPSLQLKVLVVRCGFPPNNFQADSPLSEKSVLRLLRSVVGSCIFSVILSIPQFSDFLDNPARLIATLESVNLTSQLVTRPSGAGDILHQRDPPVCLRCRAESRFWHTNSDVVHGAHPVSLRGVQALQWEPRVQFPASEYDTYHDLFFFFCVVSVRDNEHPPARRNLKIKNSNHGGLHRMAAPCIAPANRHPNSDVVHGAHPLSLALRSSSGSPGFDSRRLNTLYKLGRGAWCTPTLPSPNSRRLNIMATVPAFFFFFCDQSYPTLYRWSTAGHPSTSAEWYIPARRIAIEATIGHPAQPYTNSDHGAPPLSLITKVQKVQWELQLPLPVRAPSTDIYEDVEDDHTDEEDQRDFTWM